MAGRMTVSKWGSSDADRPLVAWGKALRETRARRRDQRILLGLTAAAVLVTLSPLAFHRPTLRLLWNVTPSAPTGLYRVDPIAPLHVGDWVAVAVPATARAMAVERHYIPPHVPLLKRIASGSGGQVCALSAHLFIAGEPVATRRRADAAGRALPWWEGCRTLRRDEIFLLNAGAPDSFDGRYFGPSPMADIVGIASPLWVR